MRFFEMAIYTYDVEFVRKSFELFNPYPNDIIKGVDVIMDAIEAYTSGEPSRRNEESVLKMVIFLHEELNFPIKGFIEPGERYSQCTAYSPLKCAKQAGYKQVIKYLKSDF